MRPADDLDAAIAQAAIFPDDRVSHYWDSKKILGRQVAQTLALRALVAWDTYLLYLPGAMWKGGRMPAPAFWMRQLDERPDLLLDAARLRAEVQKAIEANSKGK